MHPFVATPALILLTVSCLLHAGQASDARQATSVPATSTRDVLVIEDTRLDWRHNEQVLELVSTGDGLLVTKASAALALQLHRGDRLRTAGRTQITSVAQLIAALRAAANAPIEVHVLRDGVQVRLTWAAAAYAPLLPPRAPSPPTSG